jgi:ABC-2 type transport system permease protein
MNKIFLVIKREYLTRVRKKSFIVMTLLGPLLFGGFFAAMIWISQMKDTEVKNIAVVDSTGFFKNELPETSTIKFSYLKNVDIETLKDNFFEMEYYALLYIPHIVTYSANSVQLYSDKQPPIGMKVHITKSIEKIIENEKLKAYDIDNLEEILKSVKTDVSVQTIKLKSSGEERKSNTEVAMGIAYLSGLMIYIFIFMFGAQVMRGVIEEKTNRIIEVIISSVRPFQLMTGKISGIALVGLTQFILWIVLSVFIIQGVQTVMMPDAKDIAMQAPQSIMSVDQGSIAASADTAANKEMLELEDNMGEVQNVLKMIGLVNWPYVIAAFIFYFIGGYLLYGSLFAAIGAAVDNETDTQQFMFPITIPLILAIFVMINALNNPESPITYWCSFIPFTSPVVMMARVPFEVPVWELLVSMAILVLTFIGTTYLAGKIYRVGILMYGKKPTYKELWKWIRYR